MGEQRRRPALPAWMGAILVAGLVAGCIQPTARPSAAESRAPASDGPIPTATASTSATPAVLTPSASVSAAVPSSPAPLPATSSIDLGVLEWTRVAGAEEDLTFVLDGYGDGDGWILVGAEANPNAQDLENQMRGTIWRSPDGRAWSRAQSELVGVLLAGVTATTTGYVAVGLVGPCIPDACVRGTQVVTSPDGVTWDRLPGDAGIDGGATRILRLDGEILAYGDRPNDGSKEREGRTLLSPPMDGAIWTSAEGASWALFADLPVASRVQRVAGSGSLVVALAHDDEEGGAAIWRRDGDVWAPMSQHDGFSCCQDIAVLGDRVFVIGVSEDSPGSTTDGLMELSPDGDARSLDGLDGYEDIRIEALTVIDGTLFALGLIEDVGVLLASADGREWTSGPLPSTTSGYRDLRLGPGGLILLGSGEAWFAPVEAPRLP